MTALKQELSGARKDDTMAARQAKSEARKFIAEAMATAGREFSEDPFPTGGTGRYRCTFLSHVV